MCGEARRCRREQSAESVSRKLARVLAFCTACIVLVALPRFVGLFVSTRPCFWAFFFFFFFFWQAVVSPRERDEMNDTIACDTSTKVSWLGLHRFFGEGCEEADLRETVVVGKDHGGKGAWY